MVRSHNGAYRRNLIRAVFRRVEVISPLEIKIYGSRADLLQTLSGATS